MSLENSGKIDFIGVAPDDCCVLTVADTTIWEDPDAHITALKEKLNSYVHFIRQRGNRQPLPGR